MPKRKTKTPEDVPELGDPERKRVLNVLAQRRYRQRRREKIAELEAKANINTPPAIAQHQEGTLFPTDTPAETRYTSSSEVSPDCNGDDYVEEVPLNSADISFSQLELNQYPVDFALFQDFNFPNLPSPNPSSPEPPPQSEKEKQIQCQGYAQQQPLSTPSPAFAFPLSPDGGQLDVPIFSVVRAFSTIATTLNIMSHIFDPTYTHVLPPTPHPSLPPNLHPTAAQISIPHHPLLDTLPWPSVRDKLICMFALPSSHRPPIAQDDESFGAHKGIWQVAQDMDDPTEGARIHGNSTRWGDGNELVEESWEIGQQFYRNWWWALDGRIVENSNRRRRERGLGALRLLGDS